MIALFHTIVIAMGIRHIMIKTYAVVKDVVDSLLHLPSSSCELSVDIFARLWQLVLDQVLVLTRACSELSIRC